MVQNLSKTDSVPEHGKKTDDELQLEEELEEDSKKTSWKNQKYIPSKKRFIILSIVFTIIQLTILLLFAFVFKDDEGNGLYDLGIFIICPAIGLAISYIVENKKEAIAVSAVNGFTSVAISLTCLILVQYYLDYPTPLNITVFLFGIPAIFILVQIAVAFTMARVRVLYSKYGDSSISRASDEAMIEELKKSRQERGLEQLEIDDNKDKQE